MKGFQIFRGVALVAAVSVVSLGNVFAQGKTKLDKIEITTMLSPDIKSNVIKRFKPKNWLELEVAIKHKTRANIPSGYIDDVQVRWFVAVENPSKNPKYLKLTETVQHQNLPIDEEIYSSIYLSPATLRKISGSDRANESIIFAAGVEVYINGTVVARASSGKGGDGWWLKNTPAIGSNDDFKLLTKVDTPFAPLWWDRYLEIKPKR